MKKELLSEIDKIKSIMGLVTESIIPPGVLKAFMSRIFSQTEKDLIKNFLEVGETTMAADAKKELGTILKSGRGDGIISNLEHEIGAMAAGSDKDLARIKLNELKNLKNSFKKGAQGVEKEAGHIKSMYSSELESLSLKDFAKDGVSRKKLRDVINKIETVMTPQKLKFMEPQLEQDIKFIETNLKANNPKFYQVWSEFAKANPGKTTLFLVVGAGLLYNKVTGKGFVPAGASKVWNILFGDGSGSTESSSSTNQSTDWSQYDIPKKTTNN